MVNVLAIIALYLKRKINEILPLFTAQKEFQLKFAAIKNIQVKSMFLFLVVLFCSGRKNVEQCIDEANEVIVALHNNWQQ